MRKQPAIRKPLIDEDTALRFAEAPHQENPASPEGTDEKKKHKHHKRITIDAGDISLQLSLTFSRETYARIVSEAARKKKSVEEMLQKHLNKRYGKD
jgi:hypothetical protein